MSSNPVTTVLLIEDNQGDARLLREMFRDGGAYNTKLTHVANMSDAETQLAVPVVVMAGKPGIGKTTLCVHTAHLESWRYPDGQLFADVILVDLGPELAYSLGDRFRGQ